MNQQKILRPLSIHEASFPVCAKMSPGAGNVVSVLLLRGELSEELFRSSVRHLVSSKLILRASYEEYEKDKYVWIESKEQAPITVQSIPLEADFEKEVSQMVEARLNAVLPFGQSQLRFDLLSCLNRHAIVFCASHALMDGSSFVTVNKLLLSCFLGKKMEVESGFPLPLWEYMPEKIKAISGAFKTLGVLKLLAGLQKKSSKGAGFSVEVPAPASEHRCMWERRTFSDSGVLKLVDFAKKNHVSLHGLLGAATLFAFYDEIKGNDSIALNAIESLPLVTTMDLRRRLTTPLVSETLGSFSSGVTHLIQVNHSESSEKKYLTSAKLVDHTLNKEISADQHWKILRLYKLLGVAGMRKAFLDTTEKPLSTPVSLANFGRLSFDDVLPFQVESIDIFPAFHAMGPSINVMANTMNGVLSLTFCAGSPQLSRHTLQRYADNFLKHLNVMMSY